MRVLGGAVAVPSVVVTAVVLLAGCGSLATRSRYTPTVTVAASTAPAPLPAPLATPEPTARRGRTATPGSTPATTSAPDPTSAALDAGRPSDQCPDDALGVSVIPGASGDRYEVLITNTGGEPCALRGAPVVAVEGVDGAQLGPPAQRTREGAATRLLGIGGSVAASLRLGRIDPDGDPLQGCVLRRGTGYRVTPPHSTHPFRFDDSTARACVDGPSFMTVGPVASPRS